jgi:hypothetical protein
MSTFDSQRAAAQAIQFRRRLVDALDWTVTALNEGDTGLVRRYGIAAQLWVMHAVGDGRFSVGAGVGPYALLGLRRGEPQQDPDRDRLAGIASITAAYELAPSWRVRVLFSRVFAEHSRDTDVLMLGLGYRY